MKKEVHTGRTPYVPAKIIAQQIQRIVSVPPY